MQPTFTSVAALALLLHRENPRHARKENQAEIIDYLLNNEEVYNLARHMAQNGLNPLEVTAVFPDEDRNLIVAEGNRRICAAQLLTDPEKAPESFRTRFRALAAKSANVSSINIALFSDYETAKPWLQILHDGEQDGVGRRRWKPEQKARATTSKSSDALAVSLLDYAERNGIIDSNIRKEILVSTATRYLANPSVRSAMGIVSSATSDKVEFSGDIERFFKVLSDFFNSILDKKLHSRSTSKDWNEYATEVETNFGPAVSPSVSAPVSAPLNKPDSRKPARPTRAKVVNPEVRFIERSAPIIAELNKLSSVKLSSLYNSLTSVQLDQHPALLTAGAWVFVESLTALHGRASADFASYINGRLLTLGVDKSEARDCKISVEYISQHGNAQKHSALFTAIDARNMNNHFKILENVFVHLLRDCISARSSKP